MRIIDLTHGIEEGMITYPSPWHCRVEVTILGRHRLEGRATRQVVMGTHTGTHVDAPLHFIPDGISIDQVDLASLVGRARMVNVGPRQPKSAVTGVDLERSGQNVGEGDIMVLNTGWYREWGQGRFYFERPYLDRTAVEWIIGRRVRTLATDLPDLEDSNVTYPLGVPGPMHVMLLERGMTLVENLTNLDAIDVPDPLFVAAPLKVIGADAFPARVFALIEETI